MASDRQTGVQGTGAMFVEAAEFITDGRQEESVALARLKRRTGEEGPHLIKYRGVASHLDVMRRCVGQPGPIV